MHDFLSSNPDTNSVDTNWEKLGDSLSKIVDENVPSNMTKGKYNLPWITPEMKHKMRKRDRKFSKTRKSKNSSDWNDYRSYRNYVTKSVPKAHHDYVNDVIDKNISENPKSFWSYIKLTKTENLGIPTLKTSQKMCIIDYDKAEAVNAQFQSVFNPKLSTQVDGKGPSPFPSVPHLVIGTEGIAKQLMNLNPSKACGPDEMSNRFLKIVANELAPALAFMFQQSYDKGITSTQWHQALVTGIHKGSTKSEPSNYRPIS